MNVPGVPTSSQYAVSGYPITTWPAVMSAGKVARSTETTCPAGISSITRRRKT